MIERDPFQAQPARPAGPAPSTSAAQSDSVPASLFGDKESAKVRSQFGDRIMVLLRALREKGPAGIYDAPPPKPPVMRPKVR